MAADEDHHWGRAYWMASVLFLLSGGTGLAYEVIWFKRFSHVWGNSTLATAAVVASFLFGLGIGARQFGRLADRVRSPLQWYGFCEIGIGFLALAIPFEIQSLLALSEHISSPLQSQPVLHSLVRFVFTFIIIGPPCILMGGTMPLLIRQFTSSSSVDRPTAWLYAINTLGAAAGCYVAGFHLLPSIGLASSNMLAAALNLTVGVVAIVLSRSLVGASTRPAAEPAAPALPVDASAAFVPIALYGTAAITGCAALVLQIVWTRQLALLVGGSTYAFAAMLCVVLIGIGVGSLVFHLWLKDVPNLLYAPALVMLALVLATIIGQALILQLTALSGVVVPLRSSQSFNAVFALGMSAVLELLPALGMGILFPLFVHLTRARVGETGKTVGSIYAWNTLGTLVGATGTALVAIPTWGTTRSVTIALGLYAAAALLLFPSRHARDHLMRLAVCLLIVGAIALSPGAVDPRITNVGSFLYGYVAPEKTLQDQKLLFFKEGPSCNVLVDQALLTRLHVNGKVDASTGADMLAQLGLAYFPRFLRPAARNLLVIGFGSGTTAGASLLFPDAHVTCCEIEPAVFAASQYFADVNHSPEASPRFSLVLDDGRSFLQGTREKFDLIISEPSNPWIAGISNLFTQEFYRAARERLNDDGLLAQWVQLYNFARSDYTMILRTVMSVFPHVAILLVNPGDTILLASPSPLAGTSQSVQAAQAAVDASPDAQSDLTRWFGSADVISLLMSHLLLEGEDVRGLAESDEERVINTDLNMRLEFDAPRRLFRKTDPPTIAGDILEAVRPSWFAESFERWGGTKDQAGAFHLAAAVFASQGLLEPARQISAAGLVHDPQQPELLGDRLSMSPKDVDPETFERTFSTILTLDESRANKLGRALMQVRRYDLGNAVFKRLVALHPGSVTTWNNLAVSYWRLERKDEARKAFLQAIALDPFDESAQRTFGAFEAEADAKRGEEQPPAS